MASGKLWLPTLDKEIDRPWFLPDENALREQYRILTSIFYLVRQGDTFGERVRCVRCNGRHDHITLNCIPRPFTGVIGGLYAYYRLVSDNRLEAHLNPSQRSRFKQINKLLGGMPDLSQLHPEMARKLAMDIGADDAKLGALSMGVLEGIAPQEARRLVDKINDTGLKPPLVLEKPSALDDFRAKDLRRRRGTSIYWQS